MRLRALAVVLSVAAVLAVAGCGSGGGGGTSGNPTAAGSGGERTTASTEGTTGPTGSGETETSTSAPLTKKEFVQRAEAICRKIPTVYTEKVRALEAELKKKGQKSTPSQAHLAGAAPADHAAIEELEALTAPKGDEHKVEAIIDSLERGLKGLEAKPETQFSGPLSPYAEFQRLTKAYGLTYCSTL